MTQAAFALSEELGVPVLLRTTTRVNHTRGPVTLGELAPRPGLGRFEKDPFRQVMVPAVAREAHARLLETQSRARGLAETSPFNRAQRPGPLGHRHQRRGRTYVVDAIQELGLTDQVKFLKLGFTYPLPEDLIGDFLAGSGKGAGGGGTGAFPGRGRQGHRPGSGPDGAHPGQGRRASFPGSTSITRAWCGR